MTRVLSRRFGRSPHAVLERIRALVEGELYGVLCTQGDEQRCGSLVVENRPKFADDMTRIEAITITGRAVRLEPGASFECWGQRLLERGGYASAVEVVREALRKMRDQEREETTLRAIESYVFGGSSPGAARGRFERRAGAAPGRRARWARRLAPGWDRR